MIRKKRTFRATDEEYRTIQEYAQVKGRTVSEFVRYAALAEAKKHLKRNGLKDMLKPLVLEIMREAQENPSPVRGIAK